MVAILANVRSLHNVGSIFRTADAVGIEKLYLCGITPTPLDPFGHPRQQLTKVSLGAEKTVPWEYATSVGALISRLKRGGYKIFAIEQSPKSVPYYELSGGLTRKTNVALVVGNEILGLSPAILKKCDKVLEIPMKGKKESLNVAVAFSVVAFGLIYKK